MPAFPKALKTLELTEFYLPQNHLRNCFSEGLKSLTMHIGKGFDLPNFDVTGLPLSLEHLEISAPVPVVGWDSFALHSQLRVLKVRSDGASVNLEALPLTLQKLDVVRHGVDSHVEVLGRLDRFPALFSVHMCFPGCKRVAATCIQGGVDVSADEPME